MHAILKCLLILSFCLTSQYSGAQENENKREPAKFTVRGSVIESSTNIPISKVNIEVNGGAYTVTGTDGEFRIQVRKGDELVIRHKDFETVYYIIKNSERIKVEVRPMRSSPSLDERYKPRVGNFNSLIDSAMVYQKNNAEKSIQFITDALLVSASSKQNADAYEVLGDVYMHWKQYDLAVSNYRISLQNLTSNEANLKLADAYRKNKSYQESIGIYNSLKKSGLSNWQLTIFYEGLGDTYAAIKKYAKAIENYEQGLNAAKTHMIKPKITDLNSKIAQTYNDLGETDQAQHYFENALNLAAQENKTRAVKEKVTVADFQNTNALYKDEIELRKEALKDIESISKDSLIDNESALTSQKQNYKIGSAYFAQRDYSNAVSYLEKSIKEANKKEDLIVQKDATRKLSDVYYYSGDYEKALSTYKAYTEVVDELYVKKEQELSQAARFNRNITEKQNRITTLESDNKLSESLFQLTTERNKRQQLIIYSLIGGLLLLLITAYFMYKYIKQQRLANNLLALKSLRSQMNPHFIFNALNSVNSFIASNDERAANKYLSDFSQLMRSVLENSEEDFIPLKKEIELLELYTKLEHFRFKDKFDYTITVEDSINVEDYQIPPMLLQPYIENAVWHGLRYKLEKGHLHISIHKKNAKEITIVITDDGIGRMRSKALKTEHQKKQNSKGMGNIKKRVAILNEMYKDRIEVSVADFQEIEDVGTKVIVTLKKE